MLNYSKILLQLKEYEKSLNTVNNLLNLNKQDHKGLVQRFLIYRDTNKFDKAEADILSAYNINTSDFLTNKMLVDFFIDIKKYYKAIPYCDHMIQLNISKEYFIAMKIICKIHLGSWENLAEDMDIFKNNNNKELVFSPFRLMYFSQDNLLQKDI